MKKLLSLSLNILLLCCCTGSLLAQSVNSSVESFLQQQVNMKQLNAADITEYTVMSEHVSNLSNVHHIYFRQAFNGVEVVGTESSIHLSANGSMVNSNLKFLRKLENNIKNTQGSIPAVSAIAEVAQKMNYSLTGALTSLDTGSDNPNLYLFTDGGISQKNIPVKQVYVATDAKSMVLAWELSIYELSSKNWWNFFIDATTGEILRQDNWIIECNLTAEHSHDTPAPAPKTFVGPLNKPAALADGTYTVFAMPLENPYFGDRTSVTDPHNLTASPFGWHDTNGVAGAEFTVTRGNNTNTYEDGNNPGFQPDGGSGLIFDFPFNPVYSGGNQSESAAITNLFYWSNIIHDVLYGYGFDEASGNFQQTNYSGMALGNDAVNSEAQDGSGTCNANFGTPPDGSSPTMQMYVCSARDGDVDNMVIVHEYGHGISNRLTGGGNNTSCLSNNEQMGEGWSDWYGVMLTMREGDTGTDARPVGNWLFGQPVDGPGIRDFPYSTDLSVDPRTYNYISGTFGPHPLGSTWAAMLWELTWELIDEYGFDTDFYNGTGGNNIAMALVTEGLKMQACSPGFVDGRDGILAADLALYNGANQCLIWEAFAKRGLGFNADQGSSGSRTDGTESFDLPATSMVTPEEPLCVSQPAQVLGGGSPAGGVYSGPGVTDDGNGVSYTFDPSVAGIGSHTITYTAVSLCTTTNMDTDILEVRSDEPVVECQNIEIELDANGNATIIPQDIVTNYLPSDTYVLDQTGTFAPEDISATATTVSLGDDQVSGALPVGFEFFFYGNPYTNFYISSNGFITFTGGTESGCCSGDVIPTADNPNNLIAFAWEDLNPSAGGTITYATIGTAPNRIAIVNFNNVPLFGNSSTVQTTQVKMFEGSGAIEIHSTTVGGGPMTQGIENVDGTVGVPVPGRNSQTISITNDFVSFTPVAGEFPTNCGLQTTVTISNDSFDCDDLGANTVTVTVTDTDGNTATCTSTVTVTDPNGFCVLGVNDNALQNGIKLYPNPANDQVMVKWDLSLQLDTFELIDVTGKNVTSQTISNTSGEQMIDVSNVASGIYFARITSGNENLVIKLIIK